MKLTNAVSAPWSNASAWTNNPTVPPVNGSASLVVEFNGTSGSSYIATNDLTTTGIAGTFTNNQIELNSGSNNTNVLAGATLAFAGPNAGIFQIGGASFIISNSINLTTNMLLQGPGLGTVILAHISFMIPFVTLVVQARLQGLDKSYEEAAMDLGANEWITFQRVTFPMILPGVLSGALLAFTLSIDDFIITFFTNGPGSTTLPIYVFGLLRRVITPQLNALSTVWIIIVLIVVFMIQRMESRKV